LTVGQESIVFTVNKRDKIDYGASENSEVSGRGTSTLDLLDAIFAGGSPN
jgi:hypothetical protein